MKIVIVGAGNIGSIFAARCVEAGHDVTVVARNRRLEEIRRDGIRLKAEGSAELEQFSVKSIPELTAEVAADLILVTVQRHQFEAILPALVANPCPRICCMFNCGEDDREWQKKLGGRLIWAFPAALARTNEGVVEYVVFSAVMRFLEITTVGTTDGGDVTAAKEVNALFNRIGVPSVYHGDMRSWLFTHMAVMLPALALTVVRRREKKELRVSFQDAKQVAAALKEGLRVVSKAGLSVTPCNVRVSSFAPAFVIASLFWLAAKTRAVRQGLGGLSPNSDGEVTMMYADLKRVSEHHGVATPALDRICSGLGAS